MRHAAVDAVTVALAPDDGIFEELIRPDYPEVRTVTGGASRAQTVLNGLNDIRGADLDCRWVLVHDAARPCLPPHLLDALIQVGLEAPDGAILAVPVSDTLKAGDEAGQIQRTVDRTGLWAAQTPQLLPLLPLLEALGAAMKFGRPPTDEAEAMERSGRNPLMVVGSTTNLKITRPDDLQLAEAVLRTRSNDQNGRQGERNGERQGERQGGERDRGRDRDPVEA